MNQNAALQPIKQPARVNSNPEANPEQLDPRCAAFKAPHPELYSKAAGTIWLLESASEMIEQPKPGTDPKRAYIIICRGIRKFVVDMRAAELGVALEQMDKAWNVPRKAITTEAEGALRAREEMRIFFGLFLLVSRRTEIPANAFPSIREQIDRVAAFQEFPFLQELALHVRDVLDTVEWNRAKEAFQDESRLLKALRGKNQANRGAALQMLDCGHLPLSPAIQEYLLGIAATDPTAARALRHSPDPAAVEKDLCEILQAGEGKDIGQIAHVLGEIGSSKETIFALIDAQLAGAALSRGIFVEAVSKIRARELAVA